MRHAPPLLAVAAILACSTATQTADPAGARGDSRTITAADLSTASQLNLYDYVKATHPRWLVSVGGERDFPVSVYVNDSQLGPVETLKTVGLRDVRLVRYYDASGAQARFNRVNMGPVIQVVTP